MKPKSSVSKLEIDVHIMLYRVASVFDGSEGRKAYMYTSLDLDNI